jgi:hypothetical protein
MTTSFIIHYPELAIGEAQKGNPRQKIGVLYECVIRPRHLKLQREDPGKRWPT